MGRRPLCRAVFCLASLLHYHASRCCKNWLGCYQICWKSTDHRVCACYCWRIPYYCFDRLFVAELARSIFPQSLHSEPSAWSASAWAQLARPGETPMTRRAAAATLMPLVDVIRASESASVETSRSMPLAPPIPQQRHAGRQQPLIQSLQDQVGGPQKPLADIEKQAAERLKVAAPAEPLKNEQHKEGAASPVLRIAL